VSTSEGGRKRRRHSAEFKAKVVAACRQPGVSMAAVALAHDPVNDGVFDAAST
jgi:transposase-like protein